MRKNLSTYSFLKRWLSKSVSFLKKYDPYYMTYIIWPILYGLYYYGLVLAKIYSGFISFLNWNQLFGEKSHLTESTTGLSTEMSHFRSHRKWVIMTSFKPEMTQLDILVPFSVRIIQWGLGYYKEYYKWVIFSGWESSSHLWLDHPLLRWLVRNFIPENSKFWGKTLK